MMFEFIGILEDNANFSRRDNNAFNSVDYLKKN